MRKRLADECTVTDPPPRTRYRVSRGSPTRRPACGRGT
jgi:hypothetical protein